MFIHLKGVFFVLFSSHVGILILIGCFSSNRFDEIEHVKKCLKWKIDQTDFAETLSNLFDSIKLDQIT